MSKKVLVFAGSARKDSVNKKLAAAAADALRTAGAEVTLVDLADYPAPLYDGDLEQAEGVPETMQAFAKLVAEHDGLFIVSPEYNGHVPPLLVNLFSWVSRTDSGWKGNKRAAIAAASPGGLGGIRVLPRLRDSLAELSVMAIPGFATLPGAFEAFDDNGKLTNERAADTLNDLATRLVDAV